MTELPPVLKAFADAIAQHAEGEALKDKVPAKAIDNDGKLKWDQLDTQIDYEGRKIKLPDDPAKMPIPDAIAALKRLEKDEQTTLQVHEVIDAFPLDGVVALIKAIRQVYGWANYVGPPGFWGPQAPQMITVEIGPDPEDKIQVPWGGFQIPGIENPIYTKTTEGRRGSCLVVTGEVKKKHGAIIKELCDLAREIVARESIYQGKAIRLRPSGDTIDMQSPPEFVQTRDVREEEWIMPRVTEDLIRTNIWTLIEKTDACVKAGIPLKRGILLEGPYGTGKTITALMTAKTCVGNGWTYITLDKVQGLRAALEFAKRYEPCVIFAEDVDRAAEERNEQTNDLLNILDGVLSKTAKIMVVLTTNEVEKVHQSMLRPGRLDAVISVRPPDAESVTRLIRIYGRNLVRQDEDLTEIGAILAGQIPATIREVVERSKLSAIGRGDTQVSSRDLVTAANGMKHHLDLLNRTNTRILSTTERVGASIADVINENLGPVLAKSVACVMHANAFSLEDVQAFDDDHLNNLTRRVGERILPPNIVTEVAQAKPAGT